MGIQKKYSKMKYNFLVVTVFSSPVFYPKTDYVELKDEKSFIPGKLTQQIFFEPGLLALNDQLEASGHFALDDFFEKIPDLGRHQNTESVFFNQMENDAMNSVTQTEGEMEIQADEIEAFTESTTYEVTSTTDELYSPTETTTTEIITVTDKLYATPITATAESTKTATTKETSTRLITIQFNDPGMTTEASFFDKVRDFFARAGAWIQSWFKLNTHGI